MSYTVSGKLIDTDKQPIAFGLVYTSDSNGKPIVGSKSFTTDENGKWILNGVKDSDFITGRMVGYKQKTISAKSVVSIPNLVTGVQQKLINITLPETEKSTLSEVAIVTKKTTIKPKNIGKYVMIGGLGLLLITGIILIAKKKLI